MSIREKMEVWVDNEVAKDSLFGKTFVSLRKTGITRKIRYQMVKSQYGKEKKNPTPKMNQTRVYFEEHQEDINRNTELLKDSKSKDVYQKMISFRYTHDLKQFPEYNIDSAYFVDGVVQHETQGVFIDCGAYTGDSAQAYLKYNKEQYKRIVCFEPDDANYLKLERNLSGYDNIELVKAGVWSSDTVLFFQSGGGSASSIQKDGERGKTTVSINVCAIDNNPYCKDATYIKMDIEGSEYEALSGARETILRNRPMLAICIYHSDEDMIRLIQWINNLDLGYVFYVRQHSFDENDTVLYAIPE